MTDDTITLIPIDQLHESPFNPRKIFDEESLEELSRDIGNHGRVLSPLLVRPRTNPLFKDDPNGATGYEIVFGHRRFRAAERAGLADLHCMVRTMTDDEARRAQISENLQRKDVHPIEEAEGFQALIDSDNETADTIAEKFGKSRSYVYSRLKLLEACPEIRKACLAGEIGSEVALLIARLRTAKFQEKALGYIKAQWRANLEDGGKASYRAIRDLLNEKFTLDLKSAIFDVNDEMLLPLAGYCGRCPKRSGNAPEYEDVAEAGEKKHAFSGMLKRVDQEFGYMTHRGPDVCTDPDCFDAKKKAHLQREAEKLKADGKVVVTGNAARSAISAHGQVKGAYIPLKDVQADLKKALAAKQKKGVVYSDEVPQVVLIQDPRTGKTHKAVKAADVKEAGVKVPEPKDDGGYGSPSWKPQQERDRAKREEREAAARAMTVRNEAILDQTLRAMASQPRTTQELFWLAERVFEGTDWGVRNALARRHGFKKGDELEKVLGQWPADKLALFAVECVLLADAIVEAHQLLQGKKASQLLLASARHYGVEVPEDAPTPPSAARAKGKATAKPAAPAKSKAKTKSLGALAREKQKLQKQMDDAGVAGGSAGQADLLEETGVA